LSEIAKVKVTITDSANKQVRVLLNNATRPAGLNTLLWDGTAANGVTKVGDGTYTFKFDVTDRLGNIGTPKTLKVKVEQSNPGVTAISATSVKVGGKTSTIKYTLSEVVKSAVVTIVDTSGVEEVTVATINGTKLAGINTVTWTLATGIANKTYKVKIVATDLVDKVTTVETNTVVVDREAPNVTNITLASEPTDGNREISYTLSENAKVTVEIRLNSATGTLIKTIEANVDKTSGSNSAQWDGTNNAGAAVAPGNYVALIKAADALVNRNGVSGAGQASTAITISAPSE
jgi:flagellar hook assembly protein FlgD